MSKDIKPGDLVMIVKPQPCCGSLGPYAGIPFIAGIIGESFECMNCGSKLHVAEATLCPDGKYRLTSRLIKIDPPSEGDSLPTRADMKLGAGDTVKS